MLTAACGAAPPRDELPTREPDRSMGARAVLRPEHRVRVERNGTVLAAFEGRNAKAVLDGRHLSIELSSPDGSHRLAIEIDGSGPGVYRLAPTFEPTRAVVLLVSHGLPGRVSPAEGELRLDRMDDGYCSGSFTGRATDSHGYGYVFEGTFSAVPIRRL
jgi:hypothetical protein